MKCRVLVLLAASAAVLACGGSQQGRQTQQPAPKPATPAPATPAPEPAATSYKGGDVMDGGSVSGVVTYTGGESDATLTITKDVEVCAEHAGGTTHPARTLVKDDAGHLKNVVVRIKEIPQGKAWDPQTVTIDNVECMFEPHVAIGYVGSNVAAKNSDPILHNTNLKLSEGDRVVANIALPNEGQVVEKPLRKPGLVNVSCDVHDWMQAWIWVTDHPYAVVTGDDGSFKLENVPAGSYTLVFWHERLGEKEQPVTVAAGADAAVNVSYP